MLSILGESQWCVSDIAQCMHGWVTGWEGGRERMKALQSKESKCYSIGSHWRAFRKGVKWSDTHLRKIALIGGEKLYWKGGAWSSVERPLPVAWVKAGAHLTEVVAVGMRRKPGPRVDDILSIENPWQWQLRNGVGRRGEERRELRSSFRFLAGQVCGWWYF